MLNDVDPEELTESACASEQAETVPGMSVHEPHEDPFHLRKYSLPVCGLGHGEKG